MNRMSGIKTRTKSRMKININRKFLYCLGSIFLFGISCASNPSLPKAKSPWDSVSSISLVYQFQKPSKNPTYLFTASLSVEGAIPESARLLILIEGTEGLVVLPESRKTPEIVCQFKKDEKGVFRCKDSFVLLGFEPYMLVPISLVIESENKRYSYFKSDLLQVWKKED